MDDRDEFLRKYSHYSRQNRNNPQRFGIWPQIYCIVPPKKNRELLFNFANNKKLLDCESLLNAIESKKDVYLPFIQHYISPNLTTDQKIHNLVEGTAETNQIYVVCRVFVINSSL